jgi:exonuclease SbcC
MHISKIELENIKSHVNSIFQFARGTTAITGENGAGKTTIIEAIAWALFDLLEYKKEDFVRRGEKKGSVRVTFESGLDEREYVVFRDSGTAYNVTDPRLNTRIADKKEEVFRFLWQHLGLEPGTDLRSLFRQAIGVPQGTFTAIFLEGATERKIAFDRLLKVEEYRQAAEKLRDTQRYVETGIADIRESTARYEGELARAVPVDEEYKTYKGKTEGLAREIANLEAQIEHKRHIVNKLNELESIETTISNIKADQKRLHESMALIEKAHLEIATLEAKVGAQEKLETEAAELRQKIADLRAVQKQAIDLDQMIERMRENYRANLAQLKEAEDKSQKAGEVVSLEKRDAELVRSIAALNASLERDEKFQREIKDGFCPVLSEKCLNLKPGQTLEAFVANQFDELRAQITVFETEKSSVTAGLRTARDSQRFAAQLEGLRQRGQQLTAEGLQLAAKRSELSERLAGLAGLEKQLHGLETALRTLGDPRSHIKYLENETAREAELREKQTEIERSLVGLESDRQQLLEALEAGKFPPAAGAVYDPAQHAAERASLHEADKRFAELRATLEAAKGREQQLAAELERFAEIRKTLQAELQEKERLETVADTTAFIRDTLKEAAPRVARNYVYHVSIEAAQMFREIIGDAEKTLKWNEDYSITLEQDGFERPYHSLSGGEQMAAALAVRLALLKQLSDIRIAFFDEPTANMDVERRENFAMQLGRITHFDQLFVISHDDTFDQYVDNVITLGGRV